MLYNDSSSPLLSDEVVRLKSCDLPDEEGSYWPTLQQISALGWVHDAYDLLTSHSVFNTSYADQQGNRNLQAQVSFKSSMSWGMA